MEEIFTTLDEVATNAANHAKAALLPAIIKGTLHECDDDYGQVGCRWKYEGIPSGAYYMRQISSHPDMEGDSWGHGEFELTPVNIYALKVRDSLRGYNSVLSLLAISAKSDRPDDIYGTYAHFLDLKEWPAGTWKMKGNGDILIGGKQFTIGVYVSDSQIESYYEIKNLNIIDFSSYDLPIIFKF